MADTQETILQEYADNRGVQLRVDRERGVIPGVKLLGTVSKKGRVYPPAVIARALPLYEGMRVNIDHVDPGQRRSLRDRIGLVKNVTLKEDGLYGDFHFNPRHALAEQIAWDAENAPQNLGFSHDTRGGSRSAGGKVVVESIDKVLSVDLVANPATTNSLFESSEPDPGHRTPNQESESHMTTEPEVLQEAWSEAARKAAAAARAAKHSAAAHAATAAAADLDTPTDKAGGTKGSWDQRAAAHKKAGQAHRHAAAAARKAGDEKTAKEHDAQAARHETTYHEMTEPEPGSENERSQESNEGDLSVTEQEELATLRAEKAQRALQEAVAGELKAGGLDPANKTQCSEVFLEDLHATADPGRRKAKIDDRKALVRAAAAAGNGAVAPYSPAPLQEAGDGAAIPPATAPLAQRLARFTR
jgi:hypothetical protein